MDVADGQAHICSQESCRSHLLNAKAPCCTEEIHDHVCVLPCECHQAHCTILSHLCRTVLQLPAIVMAKLDRAYTADIHNKQQANPTLCNAADVMLA